MFLRDDRRPARDVLADETCEQTRVDVVAAADAVTDDQRDGAALVELLDAGGTRTGRRRDRDGGDHGHYGVADAAHRRSRCRSSVVSHGNSYGVAF